MDFRMEMITRKDFRKRAARLSHDYSQSTTVRLAGTATNPNGGLAT